MLPKIRFTRTASASVLAAAAVTLAMAPAAQAAPRPITPGGVNLATVVPGTSCNYGQVRVALDRVSPGLRKRLEEAAGGPAKFADIVTASPQERSGKLAFLVFTSSLTGLSVVGQQADIERTLTGVLKKCTSITPQQVARAARTN